MRLAYEIVKPDENTLTLIVFPARESKDKPEEISNALIRYSRPDAKKPWAFKSIIINQINDLSARLISDLGAAQATTTTPLLLANSFHENGGRQVVWDKRQTRFRNVSTMKAGEDTWQAVGVEGITVNTEDEEKAVQRCKRAITDMMMEKPAQAADLAKWFSNGCKVKKLASGALPDAISREFLANPDEVELAKKPIVIKVEKKVKKEKTEKKEKADKKA